MSSKGLISRMSDECLMKQEPGFPFYTQYQAVMRKFTLAGKTDKERGLLDMLLGTSLDPHSLIRIFSICFRLIPIGLTEKWIYNEEEFVILTMYR